MRALILAAGRGERMRPSTDTTPKPLLMVGGKRLIEWHLERFAAAGVREVVVNVAYLAEQFPAALGDGSRYGLHIEYSREGTAPLETGGGMLHALPLLGNAPFLAVNADIFTDFDFSRLPREPGGIAQLVLVDNPLQHSQGDFGIDAHDRLLPHADSVDTVRTLTFAGIGAYRPAIFDHWQTAIGAAAGAMVTPPRFSLTPLLRTAIARNAITWQHHRGVWIDVGTPSRLAELDARLRQEHSTRIDASKRG